MKVLSLFDGISCGRVALERAGINVENYYASEIDKYAIQISMKNYPDIIQIGDVTKVNGKDLPKIDLLIGGSPCQGFSISGKQLNFNDPRSVLFFEYVRLLKECKPKYFLLENVKMKKEYQDVISRELGVEPIEINSALLSAQNRKRLYWTNIPVIGLPEDRGIFLNDIIESGECDRLKSYAIDSNYYNGCNLKTYIEKYRKQIVFEKNKPLKIGNINNNAQSGRIYSIENKSTTLNANGGGQGAKTGLYFTNDIVRKLTPIECERLQTLPDNYTHGISNTQRYKCLGNGWTVDVIAWIFRFIKGVRNE